MVSNPVTHKGTEINSDNNKLAKQLCKPIVRKIKVKWSWSVLFI